MPNYSLRSRQQQQHLPPTSPAVADEEDIRQQQLYEALAASHDKAQLAREERERARLLRERASQYTNTILRANAAALADVAASNILSLGGSKLAAGNNKMMPSLAAATAAVQLPDIALPSSAPNQIAHPEPQSARLTFPPPGSAAVSQSRSGGEPPTRPATATIIHAAMVNAGPDVLSNVSNLGGFGQERKGRDQLFNVRRPAPPQMQKAALNQGRSTTTMDGLAHVGPSSLSATTTTIIPPIPSLAYSEPNSVAPSRPMTTSTPFGRIGRRESLVATTPNNYSATTTETDRQTNSSRVHYNTIVESLRNDQNFYINSPSAAPTPSLAALNPLQRSGANDDAMTAVGSDAASSIANSTNFRRRNDSLSAMLSSIAATQPKSSSGIAGASQQYAGFYASPAAVNGGEGSGNGSHNNTLRSTSTTLQSPTSIVAERRRQRIAGTAPYLHKVQQALHAGDEFDGAKDADIEFSSTVNGVRAHQEEDEVSDVDEDGGGVTSNSRARPPQGPQPLTSPFANQPSRSSKGFVLDALNSLTAAHAVAKAQQPVANQRASLLIDTPAEVIPITSVPPMASKVDRPSQAQKLRAVIESEIENLIASHQQHLDDGADDNATPYATASLTTVAGGPIMERQLAAVHPTSDPARIAILRGKYYTAPDMQQIKQKHNAIGEAADVELGGSIDWAPPGLASPLPPAIVIVTPAAPQSLLTRTNAHLLRAQLELKFSELLVDEQELRAFAYEREAFEYTVVHHTMRLTYQHNVIGPLLSVIHQAERADRSDVYSEEKRAFARLGEVVRRDYLAVCAVVALAARRRALLEAAAGVSVNSVNGPATAQLVSNQWSVSDETAEEIVTRLAKQKEAKLRLLTENAEAEAAAVRSTDMATQGTPAKPQGAHSATLDDDDNTMAASPNMYTTSSIVFSMSPSAYQRVFHSTSHANQLERQRRQRERDLQLQNKISLGNSINMASPNTSLISQMMSQVNVSHDLEDLADDTTDIMRLVAEAQEDLQLFPEKIDQYNAIANKENNMEEGEEEEGASDRAADEIAMETTANGLQDDRPLDDTIAGGNNESDGLLFDSVNMPTNPNLASVVVEGAGAMQTSTDDGSSFVNAGSNNVNSTDSTTNITGTFSRAKKSKSASNNTTTATQGKRKSWKGWDADQVGANEGGEGVVMSPEGFDAASPSVIETDVEHGQPIANANVSFVPAASDGAAVNFVPHKPPTSMKGSSSSIRHGDGPTSQASQMYTTSQSPTSQYKAHSNIYASSKAIRERSASIAQQEDEVRKEIALLAAESNLPVNVVEKLVKMGTLTLNSATTQQQNPQQHQQQMQSAHSPIGLSDEEGSPLHHNFSVGVGMTSGFIRRAMVPAFSGLRLPLGIVKTLSALESHVRAAIAEEQERHFHNKFIEQMRLEGEGLLEMQRKQRHLDRLVMWRDQREQRERTAALTLRLGRLLAELHIEEDIARAREVEESEAESFYTDITLPFYVEGKSVELRALEAREDEERQFLQEYRLPASLLGAIESHETLARLHLESHGYDQVVHQPLLRHWGSISSLLGRDQQARASIIKIQRTFRKVRLGLGGWRRTHKTIGAEVAKYRSTKEAFKAQRTLSETKQMLQDETDRLIAEQEVEYGEAQIRFFNAEKKVRRSVIEEEELWARDRILLAKVSEFIHEFYNPKKRALAAEEPFARSLIEAEMFPPLTTSYSDQEPTNQSFWGTSFAIFNNVLKVLRQKEVLEVTFEPADRSQVLLDEANARSHFKIHFIKGAMSVNEFLDARGRQFIADQQEVVGEESRSRAELKAQEQHTWNTQIDDGNVFGQLYVVCTTASLRNHILAPYWREHVTDLFASYADENHRLFGRVWLDEYFIPQQLRYFQAFVEEITEPQLRSEIEFEEKRLRVQAAASQLDEEFTVTQAIARRHAAATKIQRWAKAVQEGGIVGRSGLKKYLTEQFLAKRERIELYKKMDRQRDDVDTARKELFEAITDHKVQTEKDFIPLFNKMVEVEARCRGRIDDEAVFMIGLLLKNYRYVVDEITNQQYIILVNQEQFWRQEVVNQWRYGFTNELPTTNSTDYTVTSTNADIKATYPPHRQASSPMKAPNMSGHPAFKTLGTDIITTQSAKQSAMAIFYDSYYPNPPVGGFELKKGLFVKDIKIRPAQRAWRCYKARQVRRARTLDSIERLEAAEVVSRSAILISEHSAFALSESVLAHEFYCFKLYCYDYLQVFVPQMLLWWREGTNTTSSPRIVADEESQQRIKMEWLQQNTLRYRHIEALEERERAEIYAKGWLWQLQQLRLAEEEAAARADITNSYFDMMLRAAEALSARLTSQMILTEYCQRYLKELMLDEYEPLDRRSIEEIETTERTHILVLGLYLKTRSDNFVTPEQQAYDRLMLEFTEGTVRIDKEGRNSSIFSYFRKKISDQEEEQRRLKFFIPENFEFESGVLIPCNERYHRWRIEKMWATTCAVPHRPISYTGTDTAGFYQYNGSVYLYSCELMESEQRRATLLQEDIVDFWVKMTELKDAVFLSGNGRHVVMADGKGGLSQLQPRPPSANAANRPSAVGAFQDQSAM